jgi:DNA-binding transcriptional regulator YdaS (Cro superfamily)
MIETGQSAEGFSSKFATAINNQSAQFLATYFSFQDIIRYSKEIAQTVVGTDSALIELKKVSDASNERIQQSFTKSAETAQELGSTITSVINSTADWARLGYDVDQAEELARVTTLFQTVGDNMTQETASESLISTLKGFQLETSEAIDIVDKFNEVLAARSCRNANKDGMQLNLSKTNNTLKLLGHPKANLPNVSRKTEKSGWILYGEIKAFERMSYVV